MTPPQGGKTYQRGDYTSHGRRLLTNVKETASIIETRLDSQLIEDVVFAVVTANDTNIKDNRSRLSKIGVEIVQLDPSSDKRGVAISTKEKFREFSNKILEYANTEANKGKSYLAPIESIEEVDPVKKIDIDLLDAGVHSCIIYLYPILTGLQQNAVLQAISKEITSDPEAKTRFMRSSASGYALTAVLSSEKIIKIAEEYNSVRLIKANSSLQLDRSETGSALSSGTYLKPPTSDVKVGIIDSGIAKSSPFISPLIAKVYQDLGTGITLDTDHGTLVASRVAFGENIEAQVSSGVLEPVCKLVDIPIFWNDSKGKAHSLQESDVINLLNNFIPENKDVRIFNLSFGNYIPISDNRVSSLGSELDALAKLYDVTFIIASGNLRHNNPNDWSLFPTYIGSPSSRIHSPGESILGLTVGSYSHKQDMTDIARPMELSPFSRTGPGLDGGIKPDLVSVGGNCYVSGGSGGFRHISAAVGLNARGTHLAYNVGTSFSAPIVSHYAARILGDMRDISSNLLKCYLVHFASKEGLHSSASLRPDNSYGFGEFQMADYTGEHANRMIFIHEGSITKDKYVHIPFHIPSSIDKISKKSLKVKFTVVHNPDVDVVNPSEYSLADITYSLSKRYSGIRKAVAESNSGLSRYSKKWSPIIKYERTFSRNFSAGEWELRLRLFTRGALDKKYSQDYAVIIECIDETNTIDIYKDLISEHASAYAMATPSPGAAI